jgi:hypothetical protein
MRLRGHQLDGFNAALKSGDSTKAHQELQTAAVLAEGVATLAAAPGSLLVWKQDGEYQSAHLIGHPETTLFLITPANLFLITPANPQGEVFLHGAFVPDDEERGEKWAIENAKSAAERYLTDWVKIALTVIAANAAHKPCGD